MGHHQAPLLHQHQSPFKMQCKCGGGQAALLAPKLASSLALYIHTHSHQLEERDSVITAAQERCESLLPPPPPLLVPITC